MNQLALATAWAHVSLETNMLFAITFEIKDWMSIGVGSLFVCAVLALCKARLASLRQARQTSSCTAAWWTKSYGSERWQATGHSREQDHRVMYSPWKAKACAR